MATKITVYEFESEDPQAVAQFVGAMERKWERRAPTPRLLTADGQTPEGAGTGPSTKGQTHPGEPFRNHVVNVVVNGQGATVGCESIAGNVPGNAATPDDLNKAKEEIAKDLGGLRTAVDESLDGTAKLRAQDDRNRQTINEMAEGPEKFLAGLRSRIRERENVDLFMALTEKTKDGAFERYRTFKEIGVRLGGITKQAVAARVSKFRGLYPEPWGYIDALRQPPKAACFSELSPSERKARGIDKAFDLTVK